MPQTIRMDLEVGLPSTKPFHSGEYGDALDYAAIVSRLKAFAHDHSYQLLERFTEATAQIVLEEFNAPWVKVRVAKLAPLSGVKEIGIAIERTRHP